MISRPIQTTIHVETAYEFNETDKLTLSAFLGRILGRPVTGQVQINLSQGSPQGMELNEITERIPVTSKIFKIP